MFLKSKNNYTVIILALIILTAAFLRMQNLWYMEFKGDEAANCFIASNLIHEGIFPLTGSTLSIGVYTPPAFTYLLVIPFIFSRNPVVATGFVALLNVLAVFVCYLFCNRFFNKRIALISSLFFAVNPWAILYSRKLWPINLLPLCILIFFYSLYEVVLNKKQKYIVLSFVTFAIATQLHFLTLYFVFFLAYVIFSHRPRIRPRYILSGIMISALLYLPYILFELKHNFYDLKVFYEFSQMPLRFRSESLIMPIKLAGAYGFPCSLNYSIVDILQAALLCAAIVYLVYKLKDKKYFLLLFWFVLSMLFLTISKKHAPGHYFIALFPVQFIMLGILLDKFCSWSKENFFLIVFILFLAFTQAFCSFTFFGRVIRENRNIHWIEYGPPFKYRVDEIKDAVNSGYGSAEDIHRKVSKNKALLKYDFIATQYIFYNLDYISK